MIDLTSSFSNISKKRSMMLCVFIFLILLRIGFTFISPLRGDEKEYGVIAQTIYFTPQYFNLPIEDPLVKHPLLAVYAVKASISLLGDGAIGHRLFALLAGCLTLLIFYCFLLTTQTRTASIIGLFILGLNIFHIGATIANSLTMFFSICVIYLFWKGIQEDKLWPIIGSGLVMGFGYLNKELIAGLLICIPLYGSLYHNQKGSFFKNFAILLLSFLIILFPYFFYIGNHGSISRLLDIDYMLNFRLNLQGVDFYLARFRGFMQGVHYGDLISWEHYPMGMLSGVLLILGTVIGVINARNQITKFMAVIFIFFILLISILNNAEHTWVQITIFPAIYFTSSLLATWTEKRTQTSFLIWGLMLFLTISSTQFIIDSKNAHPPHRFATIVDYDTDLMQWYYQIGQLENAIKEAKFALSICPNEIRIKKMLINYYSAKEKYKLK